MSPRRLAASIAAPILVLGAAPAALADDISNNLDSSIDSTAEVMPLNVGGTAGKTTLAVTPTNGDGKNGCNLTGSTTLTLTISSSASSVATVSPSSVTFTSCSDTKELTVTPLTEGSTTVSASQASNSTGGSFNLAPAKFTVNVTAPAPSNTAPTLTISGVTSGASYPKGSVPTATCDVADAEDGPSSFAATLSEVTGADAIDGIGSQTASCSYTDHAAGGGLTATSSVTYSIIDASAPTIGYHLDPAAPDGDHGWYRGDATLTWTVADADSPQSVVRTGCQDQVIDADQAETTYTCSATSAGGSAGPVSVSVKRDGSAPDAPSVSLLPAPNAAGWNNGDVVVSFADNGDNGPSGIADCTDPVLVDGETAGRTVDGTCTDEAGNTSVAASTTVKIDRSAPNAPLVTRSPAANAAGWNNSDVTVTFTGNGDNGPSGVASCTDQVVVDADTAFAGRSVEGTCTDLADNTSAAATELVKVDKTKPSAPTFSGLADGASYDFGAVPAEPTCTATDDLSGFAGCSVTGYGTTVGSHTLTATAYDVAGNSRTSSLTYTVAPYRWTGFYSPVDMGGVVNTVKAGSTVPLKFELFTSTAELTSTSVVSSFTTREVSCSAYTTALSDAVEVTSTGGTSLRYDTTAGQFIQNWKTPSTASKCYAVSVTTNDGQVHGPAIFKLK